MNKTKRLFICLITVFVAVQSAGGQSLGDDFWVAKEYTTSFTAPEAVPVYTVYLIGDAGDVKDKTATLAHLESFLVKEDTNAAIAFLGDNIYCCGLSNANAENRQSAQLHIDAQLDILTDFKGKIAFVPGNHDWNHDKPGGETWIRRQENYVEEILDRGNTFLPDNAGPGPVEVQLNENLTLIAIDTEWWLFPFPQDDHEQVERQFWIDFERILAKNADRQVIIVAHHPLYSVGLHGGYHPMMRRTVSLFRRITGNQQDIGHSLYRNMRDKIVNAIQPYENIIFAAGHDHNLQYLPVNGIHQLVSGSGSKTRYAAKKQPAAFTDQELGWMRLLVMPDQSVWLEVWEPEIDTEKPVFTWPIIQNN